MKLPNSQILIGSKTEAGIMFRKRNPQYNAELKAVTAGYTHYAKGRYQKKRRPINLWLCLATVLVILCCSVNDCNAARKLRRHKNKTPLTVSTMFCAMIELAWLDPFACDELSRFIQSAFGGQSHKTDRTKTQMEIKMINKLSTEQEQRLKEYRTKMFMRAVSTKTDRKKLRSGR